MLPSSDKDASPGLSVPPHESGPSGTNISDDCEAEHASVREAPHDRSSLTTLEQFVVLLSYDHTRAGVVVLVGAADEFEGVSAPMDHEALKPSRKPQSSDVNSTCRYLVLDV